MAYIGLTTPIFALGDYTAAIPTYTKGFVCGKAMSTDIDPQYAEGSLYGDNSQAEYDNEFKNANITLGTTTLPVEAEEVLYGHTVSEDKNEITDSAGDEANYVGMGIVTQEKVSGVSKFVAMWMYKVKFQGGKESFKTKGDNIEYQTPSISGKAIALDKTDEKGKKMWRDRKIFNTEAEAITWLKTKANINTL